MFSCLVAPSGEVVRSGAYRGTRGAELLEQELLKRLATAEIHPRDSQSEGGHRNFLRDSEICSCERKTSAAHLRQSGTE